MQKLFDFALICAIGLIGAFLVLEWFSGCGETYIDAKGVRHANECIFKR